MGDVLKLDDFRPHVSGRAKCIGCGHHWVGVALVGMMELECPQCTTNKGRFINSAIRSKYGHWTCKCGNDLFYITTAGNYCCNCAQWVNGDSIA